jgi:hypothetical protein
VVTKAADESPGDCERVCCQTLLITDAPTAAQTLAQTDPCDIWQHGGGKGASGSWLGVDNTKCHPPLPIVPDAPMTGTTWVGGTSRRTKGTK